MKEVIVNNLPKAEDSKLMAANDAVENSLMMQTTAEVFLEQNYVFRRNVLRGQVEYRKLEENDEAFRPLTQRALNSIILAGKHAMGEECDISRDIKLYCESEEPKDYDPVNDYLDNLPEWDGVDRIVPFCQRIPGLSAEQIYFLSIWLRSVVAMWKGMDEEHGNECLPLFIGAQGSGKSTFVLRFLPKELRKYYLDHFNLSNKFDKEMALSGSLIINLDEIDQYKSGQMAELKQALSKVSINGRQIYGKTIEQRRRYASFFGTTNSPHPLQDRTGSRRFICIEIPEGRYIDNDTEIEYDQLFAQIVYELCVKKARYWFTNEETQRIQKLNAPYQATMSLEQMIGSCYRMPEDGEPCRKVDIDEVRKVIKDQYPSVKDTSLTSIKIGLVMRSMNFEKRCDGRRTYYRVCMRKSA